MPDWVITLRIIGRWVLVAISFSAVICSFWCFAGVFVKKKLFRICLVSIMISICVFAYIMNHRSYKVVRMQENVLYVKPMPKNH